MLLLAEEYLTTPPVPGWDRELGRDSVPDNPEVAACPSLGFADVLRAHPAARTRGCQALGVMGFFSSGGGTQGPGKKSFSTWIQNVLFFSQAKRVEKESEKSVVWVSWNACH